MHVNSTRTNRKVGPMTNTDDDRNPIQTMMAHSYDMYDVYIEEGYSALQRGAMDTVFTMYSAAMLEAWKITLLLSDDDTTPLEHWHGALLKAQQIATASAVLLKARNMVLPT